jgi:hypothetical protein
MNIEYKDMIRKANICLRDKLLPNHSAFTVTEVVEALTGIPKEVVFDNLLKDRAALDAGE